MFLLYSEEGLVFIEEALLGFLYPLLLFYLYVFPGLFPFSFSFNEIQKFLVAQEHLDQALVLVFLLFQESERRAGVFHATD